MTPCGIWIVPRIWFDEVERIGMQRCTPIGYQFNGIGSLIWYFGILSLVGIPIYLATAALAGAFSWSMLWLLTMPIGVLFAGSFLIGLSWWLACRKQFHYDYERRESTWIHGGEKRSYTFIDYQKQNP